MARNSPVFTPMKPIPAVIAPARSAKTRSVKAFTLSLSKGARADCDAWREASSDCTMLRVPFLAFHAYLRKSRQGQTRRQNIYTIGSSDVETSRYQATGTKP